MLFAINLIIELIQFIYITAAIDHDTTVTRKMLSGVTHTPIPSSYRIIGSGASLLLQPLVPYCSSLHDYVVNLGQSVRLGGICLIPGGGGGGSCWSEWHFC